MVDRRLTVRRLLGGHAEMLGDRSRCWRIVEHSVSYAADGNAAMGLDRIVLPCGSWLRLMWKGVNDHWR